MLFGIFPYGDLAIPHPPYFNPLIHFRQHGLVGTLFVLWVIIRHDLILLLTLFHLRPPGAVSVDPCVSDTPVLVGFRDGPSLCGAPCTSPQGARLLMPESREAGSGCWVGSGPRDTPSFRPSQPTGKGSVCVNRPCVCSRVCVFRGNRRSVFRHTCIHGDAVTSYLCLPGGRRLLMGTQRRGLWGWLPSWVLGSRWDLKP